jgi:hypothetical protein
VGFAYFQATSSLLFLGTVYVTYLCWSFMRFLVWYLSFHCHCISALDRCECTSRCPTLSRILAHASTPAAFKKSALAFLLSSFEPFLEVTLTFLQCIEVGPQRVVARHPDVRCTAGWEALFVPALLFIIAVPIVLLVLLRQALGKPKWCCGGTVEPPGASQTPAPASAGSDMDAPYVMMDYEDVQDRGRRASAMPLVTLEPLSEAHAHPPASHGHSAHAANAHGSVLFMLSHHFKPRYAVVLGSLLSGAL